MVMSVKLQKIGLITLHAGCTHFPLYTENVYKLSTVKKRLLKVGIVNLLLLI